MTGTEIIAALRNTLSHPPADVIEIVLAYIYLVALSSSDPQDFGLWREIAAVNLSRLEWGDAIRTLITIESIPTTTLNFALCAQAASIDRASNRLTILNVIDHIPATSLPVQLPAITFVAIFDNDEDVALSYKGVFDVTVNDVKVVVGEVIVGFNNGRLARVVLNVNNLPIREHGNVVFRLAIPGAVAEARLQVIDVSQKLAPQPAEATAPAKS
jgi:hypothetical protein